MNATFKSKEKIKEEIKILDYALTNGYKIDKEKSTQTWVKLENTNGDRIMISAKKNMYYNIDYKNDKGDIFQFTSNRINGGLFVDNSNEAFYKALVELNKFLGNHLPENKKIIQEKNNFLEKKEKLSSLQDKQWNHKPIEDYSFLTNDRAIALETLKDPLFDGRLFNTYFRLASGHIITNYAFGMYSNEDLVGLEVRNKTIKTIMGEHTGVFYTNIDKKKPVDGVFYAESGIDIASCIEILKQSPGFNSNKNYLFLSFTGNLYEDKMNNIIADLDQLQITKQTKFISLTDNDFDKEENKKKGKDYDALFTAAIINKYQTPLAFSSNDIYYNYSFSNLNEKTKLDFEKIIENQNKSIDTLFPAQERFGKYLIIKKNQNQAKNELNLYIPKTITLSQAAFPDILKAIQSEHLYISHKPKLMNDWNDELKRRKGILINEKKNIILNSNTNLNKKNEHGRSIKL